MPADVHQMMKDLMAVFENKPPPTKMIPAVRITPSLPLARIYEAYSEYPGPNFDTSTDS